MSAAQSLVVRFHGGLGNQLFQWAKALSLGYEYGCQIYHDPRSLGRASEHEKRRAGPSLADLGLLPPAPTDPDLLKNVGPYPESTWRKIYKRIGIDRQHYYERALWRLSPQKYRFPLLLEGYWQSELHFKKHESYIREKLSAAIGIDQSLKLENRIVCHVRRKDYITDVAASKSLGFVGLRFYRNALQKLFVSGGSNTVFVISDEPDWVAREFSIPGWDVKPIGGENAIDDLKFLATSGSVVCSNSTFSWWGAWLSATTGGRVIAPYPWFLRRRLQVDNEQIYPNCWVKVPRE